MDVRDDSAASSHIRRSHNKIRIAYVGTIIPSHVLRRPDPFRSCICHCPPLDRDLPCNPHVSLSRPIVEGARHEDGRFWDFCIH